MSGWARRAPIRVATRQNPVSWNVAGVDPLGVSLGPTVSAQADGPGVAVKWLALLVVLALCACGVDGPPHPKGEGVSVAGEARIGIVGRL